MPATIKIRGVADEFKRLSEEIDRIEIMTVKSEGPRVVAALVEATPEDTGEAKDGWEFRVDVQGKGVISNDVEHIVYLNAGSSRQAPTMFIEKTLLAQELTPKGSIIDRTR